MAYVTSAEVVTRLGNDTAVQLTTKTGATPDTALIDGIIEEVEGNIDQVLRSRTTASVTLATYPTTFQMLRGMAMALAIFVLGSRRPPVPDAWTMQNKRAEAWLEKLAKGEINLPDAVLNRPGVSWGSEDQNAAKASR